ADNFAISPAFYRSVGYPRQTILPFLLLFTALLAIPGGQVRHPPRFRPYLTIPAEQLQTHSIHLHIIQE
ncbi:MAG: hypothetical protein LUF32_03255, partial [Clostridiales bacterium]|nr:hypothetical protein [Clostridiales bacterium]